MKYTFLFCVLFVFYSCDNKTKTLPNSTGKYSEIIIVSKETILNQEKKILIDDVFQKEILGLNRKEIEFKTIQINYNHFNNILKKHKNILILTEGGKEFSQKNKWSKNQLVFQIDLLKEKDFIEKIQKIQKLFQFNEIKNLREIYSESSNKKIEKIIKDKFKIDIVVPKEYTLVENQELFLWATYNPENKEEIKQLLVFEVELTDENIGDYVMTKMDSIFSKYLKGVKDNSYVKIEPMYKPFFQDYIYRGLWKLENGFMGGSFVAKNYFFNDKIVVTVGLVFDPLKAKRNYIKEFEAIL